MKIRLLRGVNDDKTAAMDVYTACLLLYIYTNTHQLKLIVYILCVCTHTGTDTNCRGKRGEIINISEHVKPDFWFPRRQFPPRVPSPLSAVCVFFFKYPALVLIYKRPSINRMALYPGRSARNPSCHHPPVRCRSRVDAHYSGRPYFSFLPGTKHCTGTKGYLRRANI